MLGSPKEHVESTMNLVIDKMKTYEKSKMINHKLFPAEQLKDKLFFSTFVEAELELNNIEDVIGFCFDFMPSSVEILHPDSFMLKAPNINNLINDLIARLHQYDMVLKNLHAQNLLMKKELGKED